MCTTQTMIYFLKFLIIYLLFLSLSKATDDFDDYDYYVSAVNVDPNSELNRRQVHHQLISQHFIGSNLFGSGIFSKHCFSVEDVALLATRSKFESLLPNISTSLKKLENDKSVEIMLKYFYGLEELLNIIQREEVKFFSQQAFYDAFGGYLSYLYWPLVKYSFYAGMLTYNSTVSIYSLHKHCKKVLNTIGNGWRQSMDISRMNFKIEPITQSTKDYKKNDSLVSLNGRDNPCENLLLMTDEDDTYRFETGLIVSLPQIIEANESGDHLSIRLPFKRKQHFNFNSKASAFILLKYYVTVSKCYAYRKQALEMFDVRFSKLVNEKLLPLLQRDTFYPGFGAILRISESLNRKTVVTRNIEDELEIFKHRGFYNETDGNEEPEVFPNKGDLYETEHNETSFLEQFLHMIGLHPTETDKNMKMEIIFFALVAAVIAVALIILCFCIVKKSRLKNKNRKSQHRTDEQQSCLKSMFKTCRNKKKEAASKSNISESNIGPRSSSILIGNDFDDTESRMSGQTKSSGLSLKELIHAEISRKPSKPSKEQIKALSRNKKSMKN